MPKGGKKTQKRKKTIRFDICATSRKDTLPLDEAHFDLDLEGGSNGLKESSGACCLISSSGVHPVVPAGTCPLIPTGATSSWAEVVSGGKNARETVAALKGKSPVVAAGVSKRRLW